MKKIRHTQVSIQLKKPVQWRRSEKRNEALTHKKKVKQLRKKTE